ncbi:uncharacterized protein LOC118439242 [Folsomia candida]|uniref:uncharacterized protein LOC118439242 n=1 Tax=Folsomia candida TaxID=158441 RepID=UPI001604CAAA|nr:uncharacterized protein LOC118439242 [Folsomia candida]
MNKLLISIPIFVGFFGVINSQTPCTPVDVTLLKINYIGWAGGKMHYTNLGNLGMSYSDAIEFCLCHGMEPTLIKGPDVDFMLYNFLQRLSGNSTYNSRPFWLSLNDNEREGTFRWYQNSTLLQGYTNWAPDSPVIDPLGGPHVNCVTCVSDQEYTGRQTCLWINVPCDSTCWRPLCQR